MDTNEPKIIEKTIDLEENVPMVSSRIVLKSIFLLGLFYFAFELFTKYHPYIFLDYANFSIHEFGHILFSPFGRFMVILGGSLLQLLIPLVIMTYFLFKRFWFSTFFGLFWLGDNFINVSVYIGDARTRVLPLANFFGQGTEEAHDWYNLLTMMNILNFDTTIAKVVFGTGVLCVLVALMLCLWNIIQEIQTFIKFSKSSKSSVSNS